MYSSTTTGPLAAAYAGVPTRMPTVWAKTAKLVTPAMRAVRALIQPRRQPPRMRRGGTWAATPDPPSPVCVARCGVCARTPSAVPATSIVATVASPSPATPVAR